MLSDKSIQEYKATNDRHLNYVLDCQIKKLATSRRKAPLVWMTRARLRAWYDDQSPIAWNQPIHHHNIIDEEIFEPMEPLRAARILFGT